MFPRLPRFEKSNAVAAMQLTERDREIIRQVHRHRFLRSSHIVSLISESEQQLLRRLKLLYHHGYLERPRAQIDYYHKGGSREIIYGLGARGASLLEQEHGTAWGEKNRSVERVFLEHALLVSDVMVAIELACREQNNIRYISPEELQRTHAKDKPFQWKVKVDNGLKLSVNPDRVFALESKNMSSTPERAYFFLEADRGTMPVKRRTFAQTSFFRKLLAYEATWTQEIHQRKLGIHRFRVLTVTTSAARVKSLVDACSELRRGQGLFLFADRTILSGDLLSSLWQTGKPGQMRGLLD